MAKPLNLTVGKIYVTRIRLEGNLILLQRGRVIGNVLAKGTKLVLTENDPYNNVATFEVRGGLFDKCTVHIKMHIALDLLETIEE